MTAASHLHQPSRTQEEGLALPPRPQVEASLSEKCDALLAFCQRAQELQSILRSPSAPPTSDFSVFGTTIQALKDGKLPGETPEKIALDLATLAVNHLGSHLGDSDSVYWLRVSSALAAATRSTMPDISERVGSARSDLLERQAQSTIAYQERFS